MWRIPVVPVVINLLFAAGALARHGPGERAASFIIRNTARVSGVLLLAAFLADGPRRFSAMLQRHQPSVLIAFALSQLCHFAAIAWLDAMGPRHPLQDGSAAVIYGGGAAYALTLGLAMAGSRRLPRAFEAVRTVAMYYLFLIFLTSFAGGYFALKDATHGFLAIVFAAGLACRLYIDLRRLIAFAGIGASSRRRGPRLAPD